MHLQTWIETAFAWPGRSQAKEKQVRQFLRSQGIQNSETALHFHRKSSKLTCYLKSQKAAAELQTKACHALSGRGINVLVKGLEEKDWLLKWHRYFHAKPLAHKFLIIPLWEKSKRRTGRQIPIYLDPRGDFGSGYHPSTYLSVQLMLKVAGQSSSFLDIGTGTGILAIIASKLGIQKIEGFDSHAHSAETAKLNLRINHVQGKMRSALIYAYKTGKFDLVAANLGTKPLLENKKKIFGFVRPGKYLIVSGIAGTNESSFEASFHDPDFSLIEKVKSKGWRAFLYKRK